MQQLLEAAINTVVAPTARASFRALPTDDQIEALKVLAHWSRDASLLCALFSAQNSKITEVSGLHAVKIT